MKRKIALLLSIIMLIVAMVPAQVFAAANDKDLEEVIKQVKSKFTVPDNYTEFTYDVSSYNVKKIWHLNWHGKDGIDGSVNVSVDEKGTVLNYYQYKPEKYPSSQKLPKFSKEQAKAIAEEFVNRVNPGVLSQVRYQDNTPVYTIQANEYYFYYIRTVNGIPFYGNSITVSVNRQTGDVTNYSCDWNNDLKFPSIDGAISLEKAQQAYKDKIGLELQYNAAYDNDTMKVFAAYVPKNNYAPYIDALTGEKVENSPASVYYTTSTRAESAMYDKMKLAMAAGEVAPSSIVLTEEEKKAVEKVGKLISNDDAEKIARGLKVLELTSDYKVMNYSLSKNWPNQEEFVWRLDFRKQNDEKSDYRYVSVALDAVSGEVKSFYNYYDHKTGETAQYDEKAGKAAAEALLKELQPAKFNETVYNENSNLGIRPYKEDAKPVQYNFSYNRKVNGIRFPGNSLNVGYDAVNGKITSYNAEWYNVKFPSVEKVIPVDTAYQKLFNEIGMELQYIITAQTVPTEKIIYNPGSQSGETKLVYTVKPGKPVSFDANTGNIINYDGQPYTESKPVEYSDVAGHYAESQIKVLAEHGITLGSTEFKPDQNITQKEFFTLLAKTMNYYSNYPAASGDKETENLYAFLLREGVVKESEKAPESVVTREEAVKFLIRALKFDKVADLKEIFNCEFKDVNQINPELIGYVVIAKGLKLINGYDGYFNPKDEMSRAQTAVLIYNYLQN